MVMITLALLIVVNGLLAWQNVALKEQLTVAGRGEAAHSIAAGDRLDGLEVLTPSGVRRSVFLAPGPGPILLLVFTTSCPHCENTLPVWNRLVRLFTEEGIEVLGVSLDDTDRTAAYTASHEIRFPVASVLDREYIAAHGIDGVPATILADPGGTVIGAWPGEITPEVFSGIARWAVAGGRE
jgi:peroxiredoxin